MPAIASCIYKLSCALCTLVCVHTMGNQVGATKASRWFDTKYYYVNSTTTQFEPCLLQEIRCRKAPGKLLLLSCSIGSIDIVTAQVHLWSDIQAICMEIDR